MKPEQVIIEMERAAGWLKVSGHMDENRGTAFDIATQATEKQIARKPIALLIGSGITEIALCGNCEYVVGNWQVIPNYCPDCGYPIDWEGEE